MIRAALLGALLASPALAAAPPRGSEDFQRLAPYAPWIAGQTANDGRTLCCSVADCRVVPWRIRGGGYEAFIAALDERGFPKFTDGTNAWITVPPGVIKRVPNPTGRAIACWSHDHLRDGGFYCFVLPDLTCPPARRQPRML